MSLLNIFLLLMLVSNGFSGDLPMEMNIASHSKSCDTGFRHDIDNYIISGILGPNFPSFINTNWSLFVNFEMWSPEAKRFVLNCVVYVGLDPYNKFCYNKVKDACHCDNFNNNTKSAYFEVRTLAVTKLSQQPVRFVVHHLENKSKFLISDSKILPKVFDVKDAEITLYINDVKVNEKFGTCFSNFIVKDQAIIKLCCSKTAMPCFTRIAVNGKNVAEDQSPCVNYTFTAMNTTVNLTKSYAVCDKKYIPKGYCMITSLPKMRGNYKNISQPILSLLVSLIFGLIFLGGITICAVTFCCLQCCKRKKTAPVNDTNADQN